MMMDLLQSLVIAACLALHCEFEYPSDPIGEQGLVTRHGKNYNSVGSEYRTHVTTSGGMLEGYVMHTIEGRRIFAFEGIPYGEDTGGKNRFLPPFPKSSWKGIREAKSPGQKCLQLHAFHLFQLTGSEDCLFLNVYIPEIEKRKNGTLLPVLVFIHGGAFYFGAGSEYGPAYLLQHDMILVTLNYRVGLLGFLSTGDEVLPGNLGLKDQSLALAWIQQNIKAFGGNPEQVTISGQSAGAVSVHLHMMSGLSRGKFARAIAFSGNAFNPWAIMSPKFITHQNGKIARWSRCPQRPSEAFVRCLKSKKGSQLARLLLAQYDRPFLPLVPLSAAIEPDIPGAFLTAHPDEKYARNKVAKVNFICTQTSNETQIVYSILKQLADFKIWRRFAPHILTYEHVADVKGITDKIQGFYSSKLNVFTEGDLVAEASSDRIFGYGVHKSLQIHSKIAPTYSYLYGYRARAGFGLWAGRDNRKEGSVAHVDDMPVLFNVSEYYSGYKTTDEEYGMVKMMTSLVANFVSTGEPSYEDENGKEFKVWEPVTNPRAIKVLSIKNEQVKMIPEPGQERLRFWESLGLDDVKPYIPIQ